MTAVDLSDDAQLFSHLEDILRCPVTKSGLRRATPEEMERLNSGTARKELYHYSGVLVDRVGQNALINESESLAYVVDCGGLTLSSTPS